MKLQSILIGIVFLGIGFGIGCAVNDKGNTAVDHKTHTMQSSMDGMMGNLQGKTGDEFDETFLSEMIVHHEGAVAMAQAALAASKRTELLRLARDIIAAQNQEISLMKKWQTKWFDN